MDGLLAGWLGKVIPQWYHRPMAMTLRLDDATMDQLRDRAEQEGRSMQEVVKRAVAQYLADRNDRLTAAISVVATRDAELLDRLSR